MQCVVLAGGRGTRIEKIAQGLPKPLIDVGGKPLLVHQLELLARSGISDVLLLTGYRSDAIAAVVGNGSRFGLRVSYAQEDENNLLGTAGALLSVHDRLEERSVVIYGDCMLNIDIPRMVAWHVSRRADASLLVHPNGHPEDSDLTEADSTGRIRAFHPYPHVESRYLANLVNAAVYVLERRIVTPYLGRAFPVAKPDIAKHLFPEMLKDGVGLFAYRSPEYVKDAGTPERHASVVRDLQSGRIARATLAYPQKAIFLDRDGTLNVEVNRVTTPDAFDLIDGVAKAVRKINESEYRAIVVTNQPVLARGDCDEATLARIHAKLDTLLAREGAYVDGLYYCPHHPHRGYAGEVAALKIDCECRKPKPGMLLAAKADFNIDFAQSWLVGDSTVDIRLANSLGIPSILVRTGKGGTDGIYDDKPSHTVATLSEAVDLILR